MEIEKELNDIINLQINKELYSSYLYLFMASYFDNLNLSGFSSWFKAQAEEEIKHAMKFYNYLFERNGKVILFQIEKPTNDFKDILSVLKSAYEHEKIVTKSINQIMDLAIEKNDHATKVFLNWFVEEQIEEEASSLNLYEKTKSMIDLNQPLFLLDNELKKRKSSLDFK